MNVRIVYNLIEVPRERQVKKAVRISNDVQTEFHFILNRNSVWDSDLRGSRIWEDFLANYRRYHNHEDQYSIYITKRPLYDYWFSHEEADVALISIHEWEERFSPPSLEAYLIYQIARAAINFAANLSEIMELRMVHQPVSGCLYDFCQNKDEIKVGMRAGCICQKCRNVLVGQGVDRNALYAVGKMLEYVRSVTIGE